MRRHPSDRQPDRLSGREDPLTDSAKNDRFASDISRLGLGTAQFGLDYAVDKSEIRPDREEISGILDFASGQCIRYLDTANRYGSAEKNLGDTLAGDHRFRIVTKTPSFQKQKIEKKDAEELRSAFLRSLAHLKKPKVYALITHWAPDLIAPGGEYLFDAMLALRDEGLVDKIGSSIYTAKHIDGVLEKYPVQLIQAPVSLLDQRLVSGGYLKAIKESGVELHARSAFLRGLVFCDTERLAPHFDPIKPMLNRFHESLRRLRADPLSVCIRYLLDRPEIDTIVLGVTSRNQLEEIVEAIRKAHRLPDAESFALDDPMFLDPNNWPASVLSG